MSSEFGDYLRAKRKDRHFTIKVLARLIEKSSSYVSQIESGMRPAPKTEMLEIISNALVLNKREKEKLFDLASKSRKALPDDLINYINSNNEIKETIRISKNRKVPKEEWEQFLCKLKEKFIL